MSYWTRFGTPVLISLWEGSTSGVRSISNWDPFGLLTYTVSYPNRLTVQSVFVSILR